LGSNEHEAPRSARSAPYIGFGASFVAYSVRPIRDLIYAGGAMGLFGMTWYGWFGGLLERDMRRQGQL